MEAALSAAEYKQRRDNISTDNGNLEDRVLHNPELDDEGSLWYWKQQQK